MEKADEPGARQSVSRYVPDGVEEIPAAEFQSYAVRVRFYQDNCLTLTISVPAPIVKALNLGEGDLIEVAVRKISEEECRKRYGVVPERGTERERKVVKCPVCGREGWVGFRKTRDGRVYLHVWHRGGGKCYVPVTHVEFYERYGGGA